MKNASLWTISAWLEEEEEGKLVGSRGEGRTMKIQRMSRNKWVASQRCDSLIILLFRETLRWYYETATWIRFKQLRPASEPTAECTLPKRRMLFINNETLKINSGAGVPCHKLPNVVHKEKDWQANTFRSCWGCPHRAECQKLQIEGVIALNNTERERLQPQHISCKGFRFILNMPALEWG